ncbi:MAG: hypothetical protein HYV97_04560 [Bdellovibrio sp.]|nr:hypothetical protein [Bdellovibrio sp.]
MNALTAVSLLLLGLTMAMVGIMRWNSEVEEYSEGKEISLDTFAREKGERPQELVRAFGQAIVKSESENKQMDPRQQALDEINELGSDHDLEAKFITAFDSYLATFKGQEDKQLDEIAVLFLEQQNAERIERMRAVFKVRYPDSMEKLDQMIKR